MFGENNQILFKNRKNFEKKIVVSVFVYALE